MFFSFRIMTDAQSPGRIFFNRQMNTAMKVRLQTSSKNLGLTVWNGAMDVVQYTLQVELLPQSMNREKIFFRSNSAFAALINVTLRSAAVSFCLSYIFVHILVSLGYRECSTISPLFPSLFPIEEQVYSVHVVVSPPYEHAISLLLWLVLGAFSPIRCSSHSLSLSN